MDIFDFSAKKNSIDLEEFNPAKEAVKLINSSFDTAVLTDIDESDMPRPKNVIEWLIGKKFLNLGSTRDGPIGLGPYAKQCQIELQLHEQFCPQCTDPALQERPGILNFPKDLSIANMLDRVKMLEFGKCPKCGKTNTDFVHEGIFNAPHELALCLGQRSGKCITGDSLVCTDSGMYRIDEFKKDILGFTPFEKSIWNGFNYESTSHFYEESENAVRWIYSKYGYVSSGTYNHPIQVLNENGDISDKKLSDIKEGDYCLLNYGQQIWSKVTPTFEEFKDIWNDYYKSNHHIACCNNPKVPYKMSKDLARLLGYYISEGCVRGYAISICNYDQNILDDVESIAIKLFGRKYVHRSINMIQIHGIKILMYFNFLGVNFGKSANKNIPWCIRRAPKIYVLEFLRALYEGDGCVIKGKSTVNYGTISFQLFRELQAVLLNLGILTVTSMGYTWATNGSPNQKKDTWGYELMIIGKFLIPFYKQIGFNSERKNKELQDAYDYYNHGRVKDSAYYYTRLPDQVKNRLFETYHKINDYFKDNVTLVKYEKHLISSTRYHKATKGTIFKAGWKSDYIKRIGQIGLTTRHVKWFIYEIEHSPFPGLIAFLKNDLDYLKFFLGNIFLDKIVGFEETVEKTYDFTLPQTHHFWSGGFINHNSAITAMDSTYGLEEFVMLANPQKYFGILPGSLLLHTFTATSMGHADELLWQPFKAWYDLSPWFKEYHKLLDYYGQKLGVQLYYNKATYYLYAHKRITGYCETPSTRGLRGPTRWRAAIDELGWFDCLPSTSLITTNNGLSLLEDINVGDLVLTHRNNLKKVKVKQRKGIKSITSLTTSYGFNLKGADRHGIYKLNPDLSLSWVPIESLKIDDYVVLSFNKDFPVESMKIDFRYQRDIKYLKYIPKVPTHMTNELARLLGYLSAEGYLSQHGVHISNTDKSILDDYMYCLKFCFGENLSFYKREGILNSGKVIKSISLKSRYIVDYLLSIGFDFAKAPDKAIPWSILYNGTKEQVINFIKAYHAGDGSVDKHIEFRSSSFKLMKQTQLLLARLDIFSNISKGICDSCLGKKLEPRPTYVLKLIGPDKYNYNKLIGFIKESHKKKYKIFGKSTCLDSVRKRIPYLSDIIFEKIRQSNGWYEINNIKTRLKLLPKEKAITGYTTFESNPYLLDNIRLIDPILASNIDVILENNYFFDNILNIEQLPKEETWDIEVEDDHSFIADGFVVHNCELQSTKTKISAEGIYTALHNSLETLRGAADTLRSQGMYNIPQSIICNISSPSDVNDKIMRQVRAATKNKRICAAHHATWEFNPRQTYEKLRAEHTNDLIFWRDFGAMPPMSSSPYFTDIDMLDSLCHPTKAQSILTVTPNNNQTRKWVEVKAHPTSITPRLLTIDAGCEYNSFTFTLSHYDKAKNKPVFDALLEVEPCGTTLDFEYLFEKAILPICQQAHVVQVAYDQWQSIHHIHALNNRNIAAEKHSLTWSDFEAIQGALMAGLMEFPKIELPIKTLKESPDDLLSVTRGKPVLKLMWQILTVRQIGRKVFKPSLEALSDDIFRAVCLALSYWLDDKIKEDILKRKVAGQKSTNTSGGFLGSFRSRY